MTNGTTNQEATMIGRSWLVRETVEGWWYSVVMDGRRMIVCIPKE